MTPVNKGIDVKLPDGSYTTSTHTDFLPITGIPEAATVAHIFTYLKYGSLLYVAQLCDYECDAMFIKHTVCITADINDVLTSTRFNDNGGIWTVDTFPAPQTLQANAIVGTFSSALNHYTIANCVTFFHASVFSPSLSTSCDDVDAGHFTTWPELTSAQV
jgi:hypothetical protein